MAKCPARPYAELIKSGIPGPSRSMSARSSALRPPPPSTLVVFPFGPTAAAPTRGEILVHLGALSRKPRSVKRKKSQISERDRPVSAKVQKLGMPPISPVQGLEGASSPLAEVFPVLCPLSFSKPITEAEGPLGEAVEQPLKAMPMTVWNPPSDNVGSPPREATKPKRKKLKTKADEANDSLLSNTELTAGAVSSILKDSGLGRSKGLLVDEALALSLQGVASVSLQSCLSPFCFRVGH